MSYVIDSERTIAAPLAVVWDVLTDLPRYGEWNPFCIECRSTLKPGDPIDMRVRLRSRPQSQRETIFEHVPNEYFCYGLDGGWLKAITSNRCQRLTAIDAQHTLYQSHFELSGWLMPLVRGLFRKNLEDGFRTMADGVKRRAEFLAG